jgi:hypothetical protein
MSKTSKASGTPEEQAKRKEQAAEKKQREHAEFIAGLAGNLETAKSAAAEIEQKLKDAREDAATHRALVSHLDGFYQEIDKLSKNKGVFEATDLVVDAINDIVRDAKRFAAGDLYLNRTKEFVPAGQNPPYSDVLLVSRTVQQFLQRSEQGIVDREKNLAKALREAQTIAAALSCWIETDEQPTRDAVAETMAGKPVDSWFYAADDGESYFDINRLRKVGVRASLGGE